MKLNHGSGIPYFLESGLEHKNYGLGKHSSETYILRLARLLLDYYCGAEG
jgi:hypothetical protein